MNHLVLLGDSIFDNASYVPGRPPVIDQLRTHLPVETKATLAAVDGDATADVERQLAQVPPDATHLFVSVGGNDALGYSNVLDAVADSSASLLPRLAGIHEQFQEDYSRMLRAVLGLGKATTVCTIYDSVPGLEPVAATALSIFNDVVLREAASAAVPVIDLRLICTDPSDYSGVSPIEPSAAGGEKIARAIATVYAEHDFRRKRTVVYT
jgi:hypothetical protein